MSNVSLDSSSPLVVGTGVVQDKLLVSSPSNPPFVVTRSFQTAPSDLGHADWGILADLTKNTDVDSFRSQFAACIVERIKITIVACALPKADAATRRLRIGVASRDFALSVNRSGVLDSTAFSIVGLQDYVLSHNAMPSFVVVYSRAPSGSELRFPDGLQLDLNALEVRFRYPSPVVFNTRVTDGKTAVVTMDYEITLSGSGNPFGY